MLVVCAETLAAVGFMSLAVSSFPLREMAMQLLFTVICDIDSRSEVKKSIRFYIAGKPLEFSDVDDIIRCAKVAFSYVYWVPLLALGSNSALAGAGWAQLWWTWLYVGLFAAAQAVTDILHVELQMRLNPDLGSRYRAFWHLAVPGHHRPFIAALDRRWALNSSGSDASGPAVMESISLHSRNLKLQEGYLIMVSVLLASCASMSSALATTYGKCGTLFPVGVNGC